MKLRGAPERLTIDIDATLITSHSEKEHAAGNYNGGYGFHPLHACGDETREAIGAMLKPGNAGANTAADHKTVLDRCLGQIPAEYIESLQILVRADSAGATHELADHCHDANMRFSFGYELTESVRAAILETPEDAWVPALDQDGSARENGEVVEITDRVELSSWPEGSRLIVRRERPHPGAQLSFTDHDGYRFPTILTDRSDQTSPSWNAAIASAPALRTGSVTTRTPASPSFHSRSSHSTRCGWRSCCSRTTITSGASRDRIGDLLLQRNPSARAKWSAASAPACPPITCVAAAAQRTRPTVVVSAPAASFTTASSNCSAKQQSVASADSRDCATGLLDWLTTRDQPLDTCTQADIDEWLARPRADRHIASSSRGGRWSRN